MATREEHLAWCKKRALEYVDEGQFREAVNSLMSDLSKHEDTKASSSYVMMMLGMNEAISGDIGGLRRFINGFN